MKIKLLLIPLLMGLLASPMVKGQDEEAEKSFSISGSVDTYFHTALGTEEDAPGSSFANLKGFSLGMANIIASYDGEKAGFVADLVFGPRGTDAVFYSPYYSTSAQIVNQLYAYWKPSESFTVTMGNFNTFLGYEVISPTVNINYSTSYMFSYGPFSHTGIKANVDLEGGVNILFAVMNPTDFTEFNPVSTYTLGAQLGYSGDAGGIWLNLIYGDQDGTLEDDAVDHDGDGIADDYSYGGLFQIDLTTGWDLTDNFYLGVNASIQTLGAGEVFDGTDIVDSDADNSSFAGLAIYPKLTLSETFALGFRAEYLAIKNYHLGIVGLDEDGNGNVIDLTVSGNIAVGNLMIIPELRVDMASEDTWTKKDDDELTKTMPTFNLAAVYKF